MAVINATPLEVSTAVAQLGQNIRLARIRRRMSQDELAQACGITRKTLYALETGHPGATIGTVFSVLWKLGLMGTTTALADPDADEHGKILEAARRPRRARQPAAGDNDF
jgi:DNA-binding XRE family transcriptional regulator